jgi:hypothetical protein
MRGGLVLAESVPKKVQQLKNSLIVSFQPLLLMYDLNVL